MHLYHIEIKGNDIFEFGHVASCQNMVEALKLAGELVDSIGDLTIEKLIDVKVTEIR